MTNNIPNYLYSGSLGVGRNVANDANVYLQIGPNGSATKGLLLPRVADTASVTGTKRNGLLIYSNQLGSFAYYDSASVAWRKLGYTDTTVISTKANAQKVVDDSSKVLRLLAITADGVTSVATNTGSGITGGTITSSGTIAADTSVLSTKLWAEKAVDDTAAVLRTLVGNVNTKINGLQAADGNAFLNIGINRLHWYWGAMETDGGLKLTSGSGAASGTENTSLVLVDRSGTNGSSSQLTRGITSTISTGGSGTPTNTALYLSASNATTNYAIQAAAGSVKFDYLGSSGAKFVKSNALGVLYTSDTLTATGAPLSGLTAATGANTIDNAANQQEWQWNTLTNNGGFGLKLSSTSTAATASAAHDVLNITRSGAHSNSSVTTRGINSVVTTTGTSSINYGGRFSASGASNNYGIEATGTTAGVLGQSSSSGGYGLYSYASGANSYGSYNLNVGATGTNYAVYGATSGAATTNYGGYFTSSGASVNRGVYGSGSTSGVYGITTTGLAIQGQATGGGSIVFYGEAQGTTGTNYGAQIVANGSGATTNYGGQFSATGATTNYGLNVSNGITKIDDAVHYDITTKTADYTAAATDHTILADCTSGNVTITLPAVSSTISGRVYIIKRTDNSGNTVTVDGNASETIDGATTYGLSAQYKYVKIQATSTAWFVIGNN